MGLFNQIGEYYTKEGAGIYKNGPEKGPFGRFMDILGNKWRSLLLADCMYLLLCLPVLTVGLADAGLTYITRNAAREKYAYPVQDFFATVRRTWKRALPVGIINLIVWAILGFNAFFYANSLFLRVDGSEAPVFHWLLFGLTIVGMLVFTFMTYYIPFQVVTFDLTLKQMYKNAFMFSLHNFWTNLLVFGILAVVLAVIAVPVLFIGSVEWMWVSVLAGLVFLFFYPALRSLIIQFSLFPYIRKVMIDPYYEQHPEADRKPLRALNIEVEDDEASDIVFADRDPDEYRGG